MGVLDMNEDFISFELAKKLMLKGFNAPCIAHYEEGFLQYNTKYPFALTAEELFISHNSEYTFVDAPTISQVLKWLREEKKIYVYPHYLPNSEKWMCFIYDIENIRMHTVVNTAIYEQAAIAGIEYCLDNLI